MLNELGGRVAMLACRNDVVAMYCLLLSLRLERERQIIAHKHVGLQDRVCEVGAKLRQELACRGAGEGSRERQTETGSSRRWLIHLCERLWCLAVGVHRYSSTPSYV